MLTNLPDRPAYFNFDVSVNLRGAPPWSGLAPAAHALTEANLKHAAAAGAVVIDTRSAPLFGAGHFPDSLNIGLGSAMFSTWVGFLVPGEAEIVLVVNDAAGAAKARLELGAHRLRRRARLHRGRHTDGNAPAFAVERSRPEVGGGRAAMRRSSSMCGRRGEWQNGRIESAKHIPLPRVAQTHHRSAARAASGHHLRRRIPEWHRRQLAAARALFRGLANVMGGMGAYQESRSPSWQVADLVFAGEYI